MDMNMNFMNVPVPQETVTNWIMTCIKTGIEGFLKSGSEIEWVKDSTIFTVDASVGRVKDLLTGKTYNITVREEK